MLTEFGRFLRKLRIDRAELIKDMAEKLGVTASYLSAVETGKRNIPPAWIDEITRQYHLDAAMRADLEDASTQSTKTVKLDLDGVQASRRETAVLFAREFDKVDEDTIEQIRALLKPGTNEE